MKRAAVAAVVVLALAGFSALGGLLWWNRVLEQFAATPFGSESEKVVAIPPGAGMTQTARLLAEAGVVSDASHFFRIARRLQMDRRIMAGEYGFRGALLPAQVLEQLAQGKVKLYNCTVPEGLRADETALVLERCGLASAEALRRLVRDPAFVKKAGLPAVTSLEGYLFPDTYAFPKGARPDQILLKMVARHLEEYRKADGRRKAGVALTAHQAVTLASLIEKETGVLEEQPHLSCVFHNRLREGLSLETGAGGVKSRAGAREARWADGLPPAPIANAGAGALRAALAPADCDDLHFVACGGGTHRFCPDSACLERWAGPCRQERR